jgi:Dolichyl-phosphate-mannose-protein mannosyltransferase
MHTGSPEATSGVWYSRSPFYHYMLALWLRIAGDSVVNARFISVIWGTATLVLVYLFVKELTGRIWIALIITAILSVDPFLIWYSRNIRFYQIVQCMTLLSFWLFCKGFIDRDGKKYQYGFFVVITLMLLSQELNVTYMPCFLIGFLYFYRPFILSRDWHIVASGLMVLVIYSFNALIFSAKTLTPLVAVSGRTAPLINLHLSDVSGFISVLFVGPSRMSVIYGLFFFLGIAYFLKRLNGKLIFLFSGILINLTIITTLTATITSRYIYSNYLLFVILSIYSSICIAESLGQKLSSNLTGIAIPIKKLAIGCTLLLLFSNLEVGRVLAGYKDAIIARNDEVFEHIKNNQQSGDVVISNIPSAALTSLVKLDYHLPQVREPDFGNFYLKNGMVVDRAAGSSAITNLDQLPQLLSKASRVWIHLEQDRAEKIDPEIAEYINALGHMVIQPFGASLRLWQPQDGLPQGSPNQGKDLGSY